jgi:K+-transporting ATPase ATPase A chain
LHSGPQDWKQRTVALLLLNVLLFVWGFVVLAVGSGSHAGAFE